jgi:glycosyltransferase involved in cell wall biosynthesis
MSSVDLVVPCYRYGHFLRECVESALAQAGTDIRILIIDDASPDNTAEIATDLSKESSRVTFVRHVTNKGHIATYNEGIEWASADYYMILSADDYLLPGALYRSTKLLEAHPALGFAFGRAITLIDGFGPDSTGPGDCEAACRIMPGLDFIRLSGARNIVPTPTAVVRTELQKRVGGYRSELPHSGDMELWFRLAAHSSVGILGSAQAVYRRHSNNMSLLYTTNSSLPDLQHRKAAIDYFMRTCRALLPEAEQIHRELLRSLACDAVGFASSAFNNGEMELFQQLSQFALEECPEITRSLHWMKLTCKRHLGVEKWHFLQPSVAQIRRLFSKYKQTQRTTVFDNTARTK